MSKNIFKSLTIILLCNALVYAPFLRAEQLSLPSGDLITPEITQEVYEQTVHPGRDHEIKVKVTYNVGVEEVVLYFRVIGATNYKPRAMQKIGKTDNYIAKVDTDEIKTPGIEYYVRARDLTGNSSLHGYSFSPMSVKIDTAATQPDLAGSTGVQRRY